MFPYWSDEEKRKQKVNMSKSRIAAQFRQHLGQQMRIALIEVVVHPENQARTTTSCLKSAHYSIRWLSDNRW
jgi:hypothetical protein